MSKEIIQKLALLLLPGIGEQSARFLVSKTSHWPEIFTQYWCEVEWENGKRKFQFQKKDIDSALLEAEKEWEIYDKLGAQVAFFDDSNYPRRLKHCSDAPYRIFYQGNMNWNVSRTVSVIGTRKATSYGIALTEKLIRELAPYNITLISGLAYGIDISAHKMALQMNVQNIGVLGSGLRNIYPQDHARLAEKMKANGGVISEYFADAIPDRENFPERNRIVAGMSDVVIVVEAGAKGGALITADIATSYNRDVFAFPGRVGDSSSEGCLNYIKYNKAALITSAADVAYFMQWKLVEEERKPIQRNLFNNLSELEEKLLSAIEVGKTLDMDAIAYQCGISVSMASSELLNLEFKGIIKSLPGKRYQLI